MGYIWNPDFSRLGSATVWLVAAGQIFFTLSLGMGIINTYASYVREKQDITLNGLTTSSTNDITSSVAMTQPAIAFLEDEFKWKREKAVIVVFSVLVTMTAFVIAFF